MRPDGADGAVDIIAGSYRNRYAGVLFLVSLVKAYGELLVALLAVRLLVYLALRERAHRNVVYRISAGLTQHWMRAARRLVPRRFDDRHAAIVAGFLGLLLWVAASSEKIERCKGEMAREHICRDVRHALRR